MGKATTTKRINQGQLLDHLPADTVRMSGSLDSDEEKTVEVDGMTDAELAVALDAYEHDDNFGRPAGEIQLRNARQKARGVLAGTDTFTNQEIQRATARLILRELNEE